MNRSALPTEEILEALDLSRAEPGLGFLQALFSRFNARVPFETASKIVRDAQVPDPMAKPREPAIFWNEHLQRGAGGTCFARVAAFDALLKALGFSSRKVLGRVERDFDHAALLVVQGSSTWICDVGFPLPVPLPAGEGRIETPLVELSVARTDRGFRVDLSSGVPEGPRTVEIFDREVSEESFLEQWRATFHPDLKFLTSVLLRRQEAFRVVSFSRGEVRVDDRHSRLTVPLSAPRAQRLSELFEIDRALLERAFLKTGDPDAKHPCSRLTAYLEAPIPPETAFGAIATAEGYRRLLEGVAVVTSQERTSSGWRFALAAPQDAAARGAAAALVEEVLPDPARLAIRVERHSDQSLFVSEFRVEVRHGRTVLVREALFDSAREDLLRNDSLRGRLAGTLAVDLLAWARRTSAAA